MLNNGMGMGMGMGDPAFQIQMQKPSFVTPGAGK